MNPHPFTLHDCSPRSAGTALAAGCVSSDAPRRPPPIGTSLVLAAMVGQGAAPAIGVLACSGAELVTHATGGARGGRHVKVEHHGGNLGEEGGTPRRNLGERGRSTAVRGNGEHEASVDSRDPSRSGGRRPGRRPASAAGKETVRSEPNSWPRRSPSRRPHRRLHRRLLDALDDEMVCNLTLVCTRRRVRQEHTARRLGPQRRIARRVALSLSCRRRSDRLLPLPRRCPSTAPVCRSGSASPPPLGPEGRIPVGEGLATALVNGLAGLPEECALVIDDCHAVTSEAVHQRCRSCWTIYPAAPRTPREPGGPVPVLGAAPDPRPARRAACGGLAVYPRGGGGLPSGGWARPVPGGRRGAGDPHGRMGGGPGARRAVASGAP